MKALPRLCVAVAAALLAACGPGVPVQRPNVVLIVVDTLRRDHLGAYGYERPTSPELDRLAADAVRYDAAQSQAPWTLPSVAGLLTGRDVSPLGIVDDENVLDEEFLLLAEVLRGQGYATGGIVSHKFVSSEWGFAQGFDSFDDSEARGHMAVTSPSLTDKAIAFVDAHRDQDFFLFVHYFDPHFAYVEHPEFRFERDEPYEGPIESGTRYAKLMELQGKLTSADTAELLRIYDSEIAFTDHHVGRLLARLRELDLYDRTLIIVTADHGEEFLDHGQIGHGKTLYEELVGVPLIVRFPGGEAGVVRRPVALLDLFPTILAQVGIDPPPGLDGVSLLEAGDGERFVFASTERRGGARAARDRRYKLIRPLVEDPELYDLDADPAEQRNLLDPEATGSEPPAAALERMRGALKPYASSVARSPRRILRRELSPRERRQLEELGYLRPQQPSP